MLEHDAYPQSVNDLDETYAELAAAYDQKVQPGASDSFWTERKHLCTGSVSEIGPTIVSELGPTIVSELDRQSPGSLDRLVLLLELLHQIKLGGVRDCHHGHHAGLNGVADHEVRRVGHAAGLIQ